MRIFEKFFEKNEKSSFVVDLKEQGIFINENKISFPTSIEKIEEIFGKPTQQYWESNMWRNIWDNYGICTDCGVFDNIIELKFLIKPENRLKNLPKNSFEGKILINGQPIDEIQEECIKINEYQFRKLRYGGKNENEIYCCYLTNNYDYKNNSDKNKYKLPKPSKNAIQFTDFNFKLLVIEELMYNQELLKPKFDIYEFVKLYEKREIDIEEEGYEPILEAVEYFKSLNIDQKMAKQITELYQDGGNEVYMNIAPFWDGEDNVFDIESYEDIKHFPNLKKVTLFCSDTKILDELKAKGIDAQSL